MNLVEFSISRNAKRLILPPLTICHTHFSKTSYFMKCTPGQRYCSRPFSISAAIKNGSFSVFAAMSRPIPGPSFKTRASLFLCTFFQPRGNSCITSLLVWGSATSKEDVKRCGFLTVCGMHPKFFQGSNFGGIKCAKGEGGFKKSKILLMCSKICP